MNEKILDLVNRLKLVTFSDLLLNIEGFEGNEMLSIPGLGEFNIWLWNGLSGEAVEAIIELVDNDVLEMKIVDPKAYYESGQFPFTEIAYEQKYYDYPAWLPVAFLKKGFTGDIFKNQSGAMN